MDGLVGGVRAGAVALVVLWLASPQAALAVCRFVEPVSESGEDGVLFDPSTTVVMVRAPDQHVGWECPAVDELDAGPPEGDGETMTGDAGVADGDAEDAGEEADADAGEEADADADAMSPLDASTETGRRNPSSSRSAIRTTARCADSGSTKAG